MRQVLFAWLALSFALPPVAQAATATRAAGGNCTRQARLHDRLLAELIRAHGQPQTCRNASRWTWRDGLSYTIESLEPETGVVTLQRQQGFDDGAATVAMIEKYVRGRGLGIDWRVPTVRRTADGREEEFADAGELNAKVRCRYNNAGKLVAVVVSVAL